MKEDSVKFLHIADTHFGAHYAINPKNLQRRAYGERFFRQTEKIVNEALIQHQVDFIIHSGDFFNRSQPPGEVVKRGVEPFVRAASNGVPVYIVAGNHERGKLPVGLISFHENIYLFVKPCSFLYRKKGLTVKITGHPYIREEAPSLFNRVVQKAQDNFLSTTGSNKIDYNILATHQLFEGSQVENYTFRTGKNVIGFSQIPQNYHYIASGHVHRYQVVYKDSGRARSSNGVRKILQDYDSRTWRSSIEEKTIFNVGTIVCYSGSPDRVSLQERNEPKGYVIGEITSEDARFNFQQVDATPILYQKWDLLSSPLRSYLNEARDALARLEEIRSKNPAEFAAVFRINIRGRLSKPTRRLKHLKEEAQRLGVYLTFSSHLDSKLGL
ncbi:MAG: exonuclease SbcCD subunit D [Candidatus Heimdallarchaeota archaeon]